MRFSAVVRTKDVANWAALWMRVDGQNPQKPLAFYNMQDRKIVGTSDWTRYDVVLDVSGEAVAVAFGLLLGGRGQAWISAIRFEPVGTDVPVSQFEDGQDGALADEPINLDFSLPKNTE